MAGGRDSVARKKLDTSTRLNRWPPGETPGQREVTGAQSGAMNCERSSMHAAERAPLSAQACTKFPISHQSHRLLRKPRKGDETWRRSVAALVCVCKWPQKGHTQTLALITFNYISTSLVNEVFNADSPYTQKDWHVQLNIAYLCPPKIY